MSYLGATCLLLCVFQCVSQTETTTSAGDLTFLALDTIQALTGAVAGATVAISENDGVQSSVTQSFGKAGGTISSNFFVDSCININTLMEVVVVAAVIRLQQETSFARLDDSVSGDFSPTREPLRALDGTGISYRSLMQHTSTLLDTNFDNAVRNSPPVASLDEFVIAYFNESNIFASGVTPGTPAAFRFARINIAVLAFVGGRVVEKNNLHDNFSEYLGKEFLAHIGAGNTFALLSSGGASGLTPYPLFQGTFISGASEPFAPYFQGCIADQSAQSTPLLHPAFLADYMMYSTTADIARIASQLFSSSVFASVASVMREPIQLTPSTTVISAQVAQGLGVMFFGGTQMCRALAQLRIVTASCALSRASSVVGYVTSRAYTQSGFFCTDSLQSVSLANPRTICASVTFVHSSVASGRSNDAVFAAAAAVFEDLFSSSTSASISVTTVTSQVGDFFSLYVFIAVFGSLMAVYIVTSVVQWGLLPAAKGGVIE